MERSLSCPPSPSQFPNSFWGSFCHQRVLCPVMGHNLKDALVQCWHKQTLVGSLSSYNPGNVQVSLTGYAVALEDPLSVPWLGWGHPLCLFHGNKENTFHLERLQAVISRPRNASYPRRSVFVWRSEEGSVTIPNKYMSMRAMCRWPVPGRVMSLKSKDHSLPAVQSELLGLSPSSIWCHF
jgi:hypothetical protein